MKKYLIIAGLFFAVFNMTAHAGQALKPALAQPSPCIKETFSATGTQHWKSMVVEFKNQCSEPADFQNSTISFETTNPLSTSFWGDFAPLSYPDNELYITSQSKGDGNYVATLSLHFPNFPWANSVLAPGETFFIKYGASTDAHVDGTTKVYLSSPIQTGSILLKNTTAKPTNVSQDYALVHLMANGQVVSDVQVPWNGSKTVSGLALGKYQASPENLLDNAGNTYQGTAMPSMVDVLASQTVSSTINYTLKEEFGKLKINLQNLPSELSGYTNSPMVILTESGTGNSQSQSVAWGSELLVAQLKEGSVYQFSTPLIKYNGFSCNPAFTPATLTAASVNAPSTALTYTCTQVSSTPVAINVSGAPSDLASVNVTFTPNDGSQPIEHSITLSGGSGNASLFLTEGVIFTVSTESVSGYSVQFSPQPLTAAQNGIENITFTAVPAAGGRIITYVPGWKTPPSAQLLADAGYTHVMVAFGVFSTSTPGVIYPAFDTVTKGYVQSLHDAGIKVILSLGGALTSIPNTTVSFHDVLTAAASEDAFKQTFMNSLQGLINDFAFDGFDIDIEHGLTAGGTFTQPQGDIAVMASIINTMHAQNPSLLITLTPQVANIAATAGFSEPWGNYAALTMQVHDSIAWVGIQLYNTGCAFGIDQICYGADPTSSPDFSVAMATDLLEDWPSIVNNRSTGFQPYISYLNPNQVVIGYPAPNANGASDGAPATPTSTIKRALQCLKTAQAGASSCGGYVPPKAYGSIGGVFNWEATYDQQNNFKFAKDLKPCVIDGNCG